MILRKVIVNMPMDPKDQRIQDLINHNLNRAFNIPLEDKPLILPEAPDPKKEALRNLIQDSDGRRFMPISEEERLENLRKFHEEQQRKQTERDALLAQTPEQEDLKNNED